MHLHDEVLMVDNDDDTVDHDDNIIMYDHNIKVTFFDAGAVAASITAGALSSTTSFIMLLESDPTQ